MGRVSTSSIKDTATRLAVQKLADKLDQDKAPTFKSFTLTDLTASQLVQTDANKKLASVADLTAFISGTANQISVTDNVGSVTLAITDPLAVPGKVTAGSFASPIDVTATREYGFEIHYSGNNYNATGIRSRASAVTTDTAAQFQGGLFQAANNDDINVGVLNGLVAEAIGKATTNAATIGTMRGALINTEWSAKDTVTDLRILHVRTHTRDSATEGYFSNSGYGIYLENEAVGGNGQALTSGIYFKGTNLSAGNKAFTYGIDFSGGTFATAEIRFSNGETIDNLVDGVIKLSGGGLWIDGTTGDTPTSGAGTRLMWIPDKAAFRAGDVSGTQWNAANIGDYSVAMGDGTTASGDASLATGIITTAAALGSTAMGNRTTANGMYSTAIGGRTIASGIYSTAMGRYTNAESYISVALGRWNVGGGTADSWVATDPLFEIGIGTSGVARANALTVLKNGNFGVGVTDPDERVEIFKAGTQLKLSYDATSFITFAVDVDGDLTVDSSDASYSLDLGDGRLTTAGTLTGANLYTAQHIYHTGDTDTSIEFAIDTVTVNVGGESFMTFVERPAIVHPSTATFNPDSEDIDFAFKGLTDADLLHLVASTDRVGIGKSPTLAKLDVSGTIHASSSVRGASLITGGAIGTAADTDLLQLTANNLDIRGKVVVDPLAAGHPLNIYNSNYGLRYEAVGNIEFFNDFASAVEGRAELRITAAKDVVITAAGVTTIGDGTNETSYSSTGDLSFGGSATVWNDLQFQVSSSKVPASNFPSWEAFTTNTYEYAFSPDNYAYLMSNELHHSWKEGTAANVHLHVTNKTAQSTGTDKFAKFTVYIAYADTDETWQETSLTAELTIPTGTSALTNFYLDMGDLTLTNYLIEAQIKYTVMRIDATGGTEYADSIFITQVGMHLEEDTVGSRTETEK